MVNNDKNLSRRVRMQKEKMEKALERRQDKRLESEKCHALNMLRPSLSLEERRRESMRRRSEVFNAKRLRDRKAEEMQIQVGLKLQAALPLTEKESDEEDK